MAKSCPPNSFMDGGKLFFIKHMPLLSLEYITQPLSAPVNAIFSKSPDPLKKKPQQQQTSQQLLHVCSQPLASFNHSPPPPESPSPYSSDRKLRMWLKVCSVESKDRWAENTCHFSSVIRPAEVWGVPVPNPYGASRLPMLNFTHVPSEWSHSPSRKAQVSEGGLIKISRENLKIE